jgi:iron(II)-dependent oxidoreductase
MSVFFRRKAAIRWDRANAMGATTAGSAAPPPLQWEIGNDDADNLPKSTNTRQGSPANRSLNKTESAPHLRTRTRLATAFSGADAEARLAVLKDALDEALDHWWSEDELPSTILLRDGLLALEAGHNLDEGHRTLLLRSALVRRRGMLTALRYQTDPERTAFILKEVLLEMASPLPPETLRHLREGDTQSDQWFPVLEHELNDEVRAVQGIQKALAAQALAGLTGQNRGSGQYSLLPRLHVTPLKLDQRYWSPGRVIVAVLLLVAVATGLVVQQSRAAHPSAVTIAAGEYTLLAGEIERIVAVTAFAVDRSEVTNGDYGRCVTIGVCTAPQRFGSLTRQQYFGTQAYRQFPVVYVNLNQAEVYCRWLGKRLPTADEWSIAASVAPATGRIFRFPWGNLFDPRLANTVQAGIGDTQAVGAYHPAGNTATGLMDMAGNVAEWTNSSTPDGESQMLVKGGSFADEPALVELAGQQALARTAQEPWLGFRCAAGLLTPYTDERHQ